MTRIDTNFRTKKDYEKGGSSYVREIRSKFVKFVSKMSPHSYKVNLVLFQPPWRQVFAFRPADSSDGVYLHLAKIAFLP